MKKSIIKRSRNHSYIDDRFLMDVGSILDPFWKPKSKENRFKNAMESGCAKKRDLHGQGKGSGSRAPHQPPHPPPPRTPPRISPRCPRGRAGKGLPCENTTITTMSNRRSIILQRRRSAAPRKDFEDPFVENPLPLGIEFELRRRSITPSLRHYDNENGMEVAKPQRGAKMSNRPSLR